MFDAGFLSDNVMNGCSRSGSWNVRPVADPRRVTSDLHFPQSLTASRERRAGAATKYQAQGGVISGRNCLFFVCLFVCFEAGNELLKHFSCEKQILNDILLQSLAVRVAHCSAFVHVSGFVSTDCVSRLASVSQCR